MDDRLQKLIAELRRESCPPSLMDRVARRLDRDRASSRPRQFSFLPRFAGAVLLTVVVTAATWYWTPRPSPPAPVVTIAQSTSDRALVLEQTQGAIVAIGRILIDAGNHAEDAVLSDALPHLIQTFRSAQTKLIGPL